MVSQATLPFIRYFERRLRRLFLSDFPIGWREAYDLNMLRRGAVCLGPAREPNSDTMSTLSRLLMETFFFRIAWG